VIGTRKTRAFRVLWALEEMELDYAHTPAMPRSQEVTRHAPLGKIPLLLVGNTVIKDSLAILTYLTDKHDQFTCPAGSLERAQQDAWTFRITDELDSLLWMAAQHSFLLPQEARVPEIKDALKAAYETNLARISTEFSGPFVTGSSLSVPDFLLMHCLGWARVAGFPPPPEILRAYIKELIKRPAYKRAQNLP